MSYGSATMVCPACKNGVGRLLRRHSVEMAAEHFVPRDRDPQRHERLVRHLRDVLWKQDTVEIQQCPSCGFGFAVPWAGGDPEFYSLAHQGDPHYPTSRWEFGKTLYALRAFSKPLRLAEAGAGDGAFLDLLGDGYDVVAADFDLGAVSRLRAKGYDALVGSLSDLAERGDRPFDAICMFQTLEHMAGLDEIFALLRKLVKPGGSLFLSMPNAEATAFQEEVTGLWDMPPNHVGRWTPSAIKQASEGRGFVVADLRTEPIRTFATTWQLAVSSVNGRSYQPATLERRINSIASRPLRGVLKRILALARVPGLLAKRSAYRPLSCWAHLRRL
jgi:2-polyprenyl-3-methyl-5-hydroxy-6-metoxy-1,4-benzoquinol methylase